MSVFSIAEVICTTPEFETLCRLVNAAGLYNILISDTMTLFAPTGEAFDNLPGALLEAALDDPNLLTYILFGHIISNQEILLSDLICKGGPIDVLTMENNEETFVNCDMASEVSTFIVGGGN